MKKLAYLCLAASAAIVPALAAAHDQTVEPPAKWEDVPDAKLKAPPGTTWPAPPPPVVRQAAPPAMRQAAPAPARPVPPAPVVRRVETVTVPAPPAAVHHVPPVHHAGPAHHGQVHGREMHPGRDRMIVHHGADRVEHVRVETRHPGPVHGGRYGTEWDDYGDAWDYDERGVPVYVGDGDYYPDDEDRAYVEGHGAYGYGHDGDRGYGHDGGHPGGWYGYPGYYGGYGYYGWGTVTVTETIVTTPSSVCCETAAPRHKVKKRRYKSQPRAKAYRGERG